MKRDEEKINVLESDWSHPEVISKWYAVGIMPADDDSDQDDDQVKEGGRPTLPKKKILTLDLLLGVVLGLLIHLNKKSDKKSVF